MLPRERVYDAICFQKPDKVPLEICYSPRGLYEHGQKLIDLYHKHIGDFSGYNTQEIPVVAPYNIDQKGSYHEVSEDAWGTTWEYRIFCMMGHPLKWPLQDIEGMLDSYVLPPQAVPGGAELDDYRKDVQKHKEKYFFKSSSFSLLEKMIALRRFEDVLMDIAMDTDEINKLADMIADYNAEDIRRLIYAGVDSIQFGDDYGIQQSLIMSPDLWRSFIKPRLKKLITPIKEAGIKVAFHSCGYIRELLPDFKELGVDSIWPQLPVYDVEELAACCRELKLAVAIHTDRGNVMTHGTPEDVRRAVKREADIFRPWEGGSWFYVEVDNDFPFDNIKALFDAISAYR